MADLEESALKNTKNNNPPFPKQQQQQHLLRYWEREAGQYGLCMNCMAIIHRKCVGAVFPLFSKWIEPSGWIQMH